VDARAAKRLAALQERYRVLGEEVARLDFIARGTVMRTFTRCGNAGCRCRGDPPALHGPYWTWSRSVGGKTVTRRLSQGQARLYRQWIANARKLDRIVARMEETSRAAQELLLPQKRPSRVGASRGQRGR